MTMNLQKLQGEEINIFKKMLTKYNKYDKVDLLIHKTLKSLGISKEIFKSRKVKKKKEEPVKIVQQEAAELNKYCDGDSCQIPIMKKGC